VDKNRRFAELAGICWHKARDPIMSDVGGKVCGKCGERFEDNPDYAADPREALRVMQVRKDWLCFVRSIAYTAQGISDLLLDTTGKLRDAAIKFLEAEAKP